MQEWYHRADFGSDSKFDDDGLTKCHLFFQIVAFIELVVVILHLTYQKGGWRPQQFCIVLIFKVEIHIQDQHRSSSWEDASSSWPEKDVTRQGSMPLQTYCEFLCWLDLEPIFHDVTTGEPLQVGTLTESSFIDIYRHYYSEVHLVRRARWLEIISFIGDQFWIIRFSFSQHGTTVALIAQLIIHSRPQFLTFSYQF